MTKNEKRRLEYGGGCWLLFAGFLLAIVTRQAWISTFDQFGYQLTQPTEPLKTTMMELITKCGDPFTLQVATLILMVLLWWRRRIADSLWFGALNFVGYTLVIIIKYTVVRPRPSNRLVQIGGYSFPSGHTFATTVFVLTLVALISPRLHRQWQHWLLSGLAVIAILLIMYTRVYLRVHFASDVCAGLLLAPGWWLITNAERHRCAEWLLRPFDDFYC